MMVENICLFIVYITHDKWNPNLEILTVIGHRQWLNIEIAVFLSV